MKLFTIKNTATFMTALLSDKEKVFDQFLLSEAVIVTGNTFTIDGHLNPAFYTSDDLDIMRQDAASKGRIFSEDMIRWEQARPYCYECIKGNRLPLSLKITFCLAPENVEKFLAGADSPITSDQINSLNVNVRYDGSTLTCTTGLSLNIFTMDKSLEKAWDDMFSRFLTAHGFDHEFI
ncbi:MAG: DUF5721 family protein [Lachnospiraceae bacterium]|nr:DUF5721 family protein [Lachnospiraceae bacterium]